MAYRIKDVMISESEIKDRVKKLAEQIESDFNNETIVLIVVLKGSFIFAADFIREMKGDIKIDFISVSSYGNET